MAEPLMFDSEYQFTEPVAEFYGQLEDYIIVRLDNDKVQLRKVITSKPTDKG